MRVERERLVERLRIKLDSMNIRGILCDADDTLFSTTSYLALVRRQFSIWVAQRVNRDPEEVYKVFQVILRRTYETHFVSVRRWEISVGLLGLELVGDETAFVEGLPIVLAVFSGAPRVYDGVLETLALFKEAGRKIGVVTHAPKYPLEKDWTTIKLETGGLLPYVDAVWVADENRPKGEIDWQGGADLLGLPNEQVMIFGDGIEPDVIPGLNLRMKVMAIKPEWDRHKGTLPEGVPLLDTFADAPGAILAL